MMCDMTPEVECCIKVNCKGSGVGGIVALMFVRTSSQTLYVGVSATGK